MGIQLTGSAGNYEECSAALIVKKEVKEEIG
jgi:hypothetical protein